MLCGGGRAEMDDGPEGPGLDGNRLAARRAAGAGSLIMAYDASTADRARRCLDGRGVSERKMMGALCFMAGGHMCCGVTGAALLVRVGRDAQARMLTEPHVRPMEIAGRRMSGYVLVDANGIRTAASLARWIQLGLDFTATLPPKAPAAKRRRPVA
jgi:hypothetical protein